MSLSLIRPYFKARCEAVGLRSVGDAFNVDEVAASIIDMGFHVGFFNSTGIKLNQNDQEIESSVEVTFYLKGFRNPQDGFDKAVVKVEQLIREVEKPENRLGSCLKNVSLDSINIEPYSGDNDNLIKVRTAFDVVTSLNL